MASRRTHATVGRLRFAGIVVILVVVVGLLGACGSTEDSAGTGAGGADDSTPAAPDEATTSTVPAATTSTTDGRPSGTPAPEWLGTRVLPVTADGTGEVQPTPLELWDRQLWTEDLLPPPADDAFESAVVPVPADVAARSTWQPACPVTLEQLRYVTVSFFGFDGLFHTGELLVHVEAADGMVEVFRRLHEARFPIEEMRITRPDELDAPPTGDGNNTGAFVCRPVTGGSGWSEHAYGLAIDVNSFQNPYVKGDSVLPELASSYLDRGNVRLGMILPGDVVVQAFASIGWEWGGGWNSLKDFQHFSHDDR
jgi:hypothetical protein